MKIRKFLMGISCAFFMVMISIGFLVEFHPMQSALEKTQLGIKTDLPILIMNNGDLASTATSGNGTFVAPYIIENLVINGTGSDHGIQIYNTNLPFIIRNCTINHTIVGGGGIRLNGVLNGQIMNNTIIYASTGIELVDSNCTSTYNNSISYANDGMEVYLSINNSIYNNSIAYSSNAGIHFFRSSNNVIKFNTINYNSFGLLFMYSDYNNITFNTLLGNTRCILEQTCAGNYYLENHCNNGIQIASFIWAYSLIGLILGICILQLLQEFKISAGNKKIEKYTN